MRRAAAVLAAAVMVVGALVVRDRLDDDRPAGRDAGDSAATLVCDPTLAELCAQLVVGEDGVEVLLEDVPGAARRFGDSDLGGGEAEQVDGWLVPGPLPAMVEEQRGRAGLAPAFAEVSEPIARSPVVLVIWEDRAEVLEGTCPGGTVGWRCVGDAAGRPWEELGGPSAWGRLTPGFEPPAATAEGLVVIGNAATGYFGTSDFAANDLDTAFRTWLRGLEGAVPDFPATAGTPLDQLLAAGPAAYDLVATLESEAGPKVERSRDRERLLLVVPEPAATADVVIATRPGPGGERLADLLGGERAAELLAAQGWRVEGRPLAPGLDGALVLPPGSGLPAPGVLEALRTL